MTETVTAGLGPLDGLVMTVYGRAMMDTRRYRFFSKLFERLITPEGMLVTGVIFIAVAVLISR